ncbi:MAG: hypothetical protein EBZ67_13995 [Chitinophagia bacterium]|nr:hypothetical protein [Chitinophagia bacterium]
MRNLILAGITLHALYACHERRTDMVPASDRKSLFLPATSFIATELTSIDSLPVAVLRYRTSWQGNDTGIVAKPIFRKLMEGWFGKEFAEAPLHADYRRKIFLDATLGRVTITCDTEDEAAPIRRVDILMDPETEAIRSLYVEKVSYTLDGGIIQKLYWSAGRQCRISKTTADGQPTGHSEDITYAWGTVQP